MGDLPYALSLKEWKILSVSQDCLRAGDLIFAGLNEKTIHHVAIVIGKEKIFHCTKKDNACVDTVMAFFHKYPLSCRNREELLKIRDYRTYFSSDKKEA